MKSLVACSLSLAVFVTEGDEDITVIQQDLRNLKLFLPTLYVKEKNKYLFDIVWPNFKNSKFPNSIKFLCEKSEG